MSSPAVRRCSTVTSSPRAISAVASARPVIPLAPVTRTFIAPSPRRHRRRPSPTAPPGSPAARRTAPFRPSCADLDPVDLGVVPDVHRQGLSDQHRRHRPAGRSPGGVGRSPSEPAGRRGRSARRPPAGCRPGRRRPRRLPGRLPATGCRGSAGQPVCTRCSIPTGVTGPSAVLITCTDAALHPEPAGARPAHRHRRCGASRGGRPRPGRSATGVVRSSRCARANPDLAADTRPVGQLGAGHPGRVQRRDQQLDARQRPADAHAVAGTGGLDLRPARCRSAAGLRSFRRGCA